MQKLVNILPRHLNMDTAYGEMPAEDSPLIKGVGWNYNGNPDLAATTGSEEGQNAVVLTPMQSNKRVPEALLPDGYNMNSGTFYSVMTREFYYMNFNGNGHHGIYVISGDTGAWNKVIIDPELGFSDSPEHYMKDHRVSLRPIYNSNKEIIEKILTITDGNGWQKWILVQTAIQTDGFNPVLFPYFRLQPPHFDRRELLEWAYRPCMYNPVAELIANTDADKGTINRLIDRAFQFACVFNYTDGRQTVLSPYSLPLIVKSEDYQSNPDNLPKKALITLYAGSPLVESIDLYVRELKKAEGLASIETWGDFKKYDRLYRFESRGLVLGTEYWKRTDTWEAFSYDPVFNTIEYTFDNSKLSDIAPLDTVAIQNDLPQVSIAQAPLGDSLALAGNRMNYDNVLPKTIKNLKVIVADKPTTHCDRPLRKIRLYALTVRAGITFSYLSQVGYYLGADTQVRFGGMITGRNNQVGVDDGESKAFGLDFADRKAYRCYLKGTPYFSDGKWFQVNSDNSMIELDTVLDFSNGDRKQYAQEVFINGGYFICVFDFLVEAGHYTATMGRHNVASTDDYRNTSGYVVGIASSRKKSITLLPDVNDNVRVTTIKPDAVVSHSKEMELDCTSADIDPWGNGKDIFYLYAPDFEHKTGPGRFRFIEGYLQESADNPLGVELFPYHLVRPDLRDCTDISGVFTDKNGFYFGMTKVTNSDRVSVQFIVKLNCLQNQKFLVPASEDGIGWKKNKPAYISDNNQGKVGDCNRIIFRGRFTSPDGTIGYSGIAVSMVDGPTVFTGSDGSFEMIVHNGQSVLRLSNVYINSSSTFRISLPNCGIVPVYVFDENRVNCSSCIERIYPLPLHGAIMIEGGSQTSLKENSTYPVGFACADLAGRLQYVQVIGNVQVPSFVTKGQVLASFFQLLIQGKLSIDPDLKWLAPYVGDALSVQKYTQWVGDSLQYVNGKGEVVSDPASAVFCSITIDSLYNYNAANNFTLLSSYQFSSGDRIRFLDNGGGVLLKDEVDMQILGTNYNQAAIVSGLIDNPTQNPVNNITVNTTAATTQNNTSITLFVRYDTRLDQLIKAGGFWIELYTPRQQEKTIPFHELNWYPVIRGEVASFTGYDNTGAPRYDFPVVLDIPYWDTYLFERTINIKNVGDKFFNHAFCSANISDSFGFQVSSGGRTWIKNDDARKIWKKGQIIRSDVFTSGGVINGLGSFRSTNAKDFSAFPYGGIVTVRSERSIVLFICENDWFTTSFDFHFAYPNAQGIMVVNLDNGLSTPHQKTSDKYGCEMEHTKTILYSDGLTQWWDQKNASWVLCDFTQARDVARISLQSENKVLELGIKSHLSAKAKFVAEWNLTHERKDHFDVVAGFDDVHGNTYVTFRPRRGNSNEPSSYVNLRRSADIRHQETFVFNRQAGRWARMTNFAPEGYGTLKGGVSGEEFFTLAAGIPYRHHHIGRPTFLNYYGVQTEPVITCVLSEVPAIVKLLQSTSLDLQGSTMYVDMVYSDQFDSFSYVPVNRFSNRENRQYAAFFRDMNSYPDTNPLSGFRSMLFDGKRLFGNYFVIRYIGDPAHAGNYFVLRNIVCQIAQSSGGN